MLTKASLFVHTSLIPCEPKHLAKNCEVEQMAHSRIKVLLIEDNPVQAKLMEQLLHESSSPGFVVQVAGKLCAGRGRVGSNGSVDVVLLGLVLPDSEDLETFARLHARAPNLPVVVLTGLEDVSLAARAVELGAQDYLV